MKKCKGAVNSVETFGLVDGPGVRFVIFLQGCNMRCRYCHNPETWKLESDEMQLYDAETLFNKAFKYSNYWGENLESGGITVSGGEPLLQIDFITQLFKIAKKHNVHTAIDTAGQPFSNSKEYLEKFDELLKVTDLFIVDIKAFDENLHRSLTGFTNSNIKQMLTYLSDKNKPIWIRRVLVPNLTDGETDLKQTAEFIKTLRTVEKVEVLPYHSFGVAKWQKLGLKYFLENTNSPTKEEVERAEKLLNIK